MLWTACGWHAGAVVTRRPMPKDCYLRTMERLGLRDGRQTFRKDHNDGRLYQWDSHAEHVEVYNKRGTHLGVTSPTDPVLRIGTAKRGRTIDV